VSTPARATYEARLMGNLGQLSAPALHDSAWIGPFEQLVGAAFSLIESEKRGFSRREYCPRYHPLVQSKIVGLLGDFEAGRESAQQDALDNWLCRYYFNSGIQRLNFAAERLVATFAALPCKCGVRPPEVAINNHRPPNFQQRLSGAQVRLTHIQTEYTTPLTKLQFVLDQFGSRYDRNHSFDPSKGLAMIRHDVNSRKHAVYKRLEVLDALPRSASGTVTWSKAGFNARMQIAVECLELVVGAYCELIAWYPVAKF
jgi:hypothetical protein